MTEIPPEAARPPQAQRIIGQRREAIEAGQGIDWATAEHLAFGSLVREGFPVRLSGQDVGRGTFSQRHAILYDQETEERYIPLNHLDPEQAAASRSSTASCPRRACSASSTATRSPTRTRSCCGRRSSATSPTARRSISTSSSRAGEAKWLRMSGLVCLLPHGYEGQGPEHSSARLERFLQLYAKDNIQVLYPSTPASYFHALRRQMHRPFRKPLIVMTPKSLLRHKLCTSSLEEMGPGSSFHRVMYERPPSPADRDVDPRRAVQRQGLLRPRAAPAGARPRGASWPAPARAAGAVPGRDPGRGAGPLRQARSQVDLVPGGAAEHGRLELRRAAHRGGAGADRHAPDAADLRRPAAGRVARDRPVPAACARAERAWSRRR